MGNGDTSSSRGYNKGNGDDDDESTAFLDSNMNMHQNHPLSSYHSNKITDSMYHLQNRQPSTEIGDRLLFGIDNQIPSGVSLEPITGSNSGGVSEGSGKVVFTATQWQELERQTMIYKYMMASIPVPHQLLTPLSTQSNKTGMDLRFSSGSDPEPWRCRRTDGKKWRCSRDVAPDQKYCERHAHKTRPRSRKPVEIQSHTTTTPTANTNSDMLSNARCSEWFMKSGTVPVSSSNQQFQKSMTMTSPRVGSKRNQQDFDGNHQHESLLNYSNLQLETTSSERRQHFIDAWSRSAGGDNCSLTLSMQCNGGFNDDNQSYQIGVGMLDVERGGNIDVLNQASWMGSPPGGPLGEALGLGITNGPLNVPSLHGHSTSTTANSSCDNTGSHAHELSFIR